LVASGVIAACSSSPSTSNERTATSDAITITGLFRTGVDDLGAQLALGAVDPHYKVSSTDVRCASTAAIATARPQLAPPTAWIANISPATWISCQLNGAGNNTTDYTYTTSFTVPDGMPPSTVTISGSWACDDYCSIFVNGHDTGVVSQNPNFNPNPPQPGIVPAPTPFVVLAGSTFFQAGINTIDFVVHNVTGVQGLQIVSINATGGCAVDTDCETSTFCNTETELCVAQLDNGEPIPTIQGHDPELDGTCTEEVGAIVCTSGVCDTADDLCGYDIGHACTANQECRSNQCDPTTNVCIPGCIVDSDCDTGNFCNTELEMCVPQLANGKPIPTIPGHDPELDGICTPDVGAIVCVSGVCDTSDDLCGFGFGHPCTASPECRSNNCNMDTGLCDLPCCGNTYGANMDGKCVICEDAGPGNDAGADASSDASDASADATTPVNTPAGGTPETPGNAGNGSPAQPSGNGNSSSGGGCQMGGGAANADFATLAGMLAMTVGAVRRRRTARS